MRNGILGLFTAVALGACGGGSDAPPPVVAAPAPAPQKLACADLTPAALDQAATGPVEITRAAVVAASAQVPEHCRVEGVLKPEAGSNIRFAVNVPSAGWNGKFLMLGNGGYGGETPRPAGVDVASGYATATTDTGHLASQGARAFFNNRIAEVDYGHRAIHLTTVAAKQITGALAGKPPERAYFNGCSTGGRQALVSAQRYPEDFDGIIAGAPALHLTGLAVEQNWSLQQFRKNNFAGNIFGKTALLTEAVKTACADPGDPLRLIARPEQCSFDPAVLQCAVGQDPATCLTSEQVTAVKAVYEGPQTSWGRQWYPGKPVGSESSWASWLVADSSNPATWAPLQSGFGFSFVNNLFFETDPPQTYTWSDFNFDTDPYQGGFMARILDATNPDLSPLAARKAKLLMYHGMGDGLIGWQPTLDYYQQVRGLMGSDRTSEFARLFLVPGMDHCDSFPRGGVSVAGPTWLSALENWVEKGVAPESVAGKNHPMDTTTVFTRPVCAWPKAATYTGSGDRLDARNYSCQ